MTKVELLEKIKIFINQDTDGGKISDKYLYEKLLKRYNILEKDLNEDTEREMRFFIHNEDELYIYRIVLEYVKGVKDDKIKVTKKSIYFDLLIVYLTDTERILFAIVHSFYMPYFTKKFKENREKHKERIEIVKKDLKNKENELIYKLWVKNKIYKNI